MVLINYTTTSYIWRGLRLCSTWRYLVLGIIHMDYSSKIHTWEKPLVSWPASIVSKGKEIMLFPIHSRYSRKCPMNSAGLHIWPNVAAWKGEVSLIPYPCIFLHHLCFVWGWTLLLDFRSSSLLQTGWAVIPHSTCEVISARESGQTWHLKTEIVLSKSKEVCYFAMILCYTSGAAN